MPERQWRPAPSTDRPRRRVDAAVERAAVSSRRINHKRTPAGSPDKEDKSLDFNALPRASLRHFGGYILMVRSNGEVLLRIAGKLAG